MIALAAGSPPEEIAARFELGSASKLQQVVATDRDRLRPSNLRLVLEREIADASRLLDLVTSTHASPVVRSTRSRRPDVLELLLDHHLRLLAVRDAASAAGDLHIGERADAQVPVSTDALQMRSGSATFDSIAAAFDLDDPGEAIALVEGDLDAYRCSSVTRLRDRQVADLDVRIGLVFERLASTSASTTDADLADAVNLLRKRAQVRGAFVAAPIDGPRHSSRRWGDPHARHCCAGGSVRGRDLVRLLTRSRDPIDRAIGERPTSSDAGRSPVRRNAS